MLKQYAIPCRGNPAGSGDNGVLGGPAVFCAPGENIQKIVRTFVKNNRSVTDCHNAVLCRGNPAAGGGGGGDNGVLGGPAVFLPRVTMLETVLRVVVVKHIKVKPCHAMKCHAMPCRGNPAVFVLFCLFRC